MSLLGNIFLSSCSVRVARHKIMAALMCFVGYFMLSASATLANQYSYVDVAISDAIADLDRATFDEKVAHVEELLRNVITSAHSNQQIKEKDISSRLALLEGVKQAKNEGISGKTLGVLQKLVNCLDLVEALEALQEKRIVDGSDRLAAIRRQLWQELQRRGNGAAFAYPFILSRSVKGTLLHRWYGYADQHLTAFELIGNAGTSGARWEEVRLPHISATTAQVIGELRFDRMSTNSMTGRPAFLLLAMPGNEEDAYKFEGAFVSILPLLAMHGVIPVVLESTDQRRPIMAVPAVRIAAAPNPPEYALSLVYLNKDVEISMLMSIKGSNQRSIGNAALQAAALADEIELAFKEDSYYSTSALLPMLPSVEVPFSNDLIALQRLYAPQRVLSVIDTLSGSSVELMVDDTLELESLFTNKWGKFQIARLGVSVWVPLDRVRPIANAPQKQRYELLPLGRPDGPPLREPLRGLR
jgi:hypothetical protein